MSEHIRAADQRVRAGDSLSLNCRTDDMKKRRLTEEQIIGVLREKEAGAKVADLARKPAISEATLSNWKAKFGTMDVSEAKRYALR